MKIKRLFRTFFQDNAVVASYVGTFLYTSLRGQRLADSQRLADHQPARAGAILLLLYTYFFAASLAIRAFTRLSLAL